MAGIRPTRPPFTVTKKSRWVGWGLYVCTVRTAKRNPAHCALPSWPKIPPPLPAIYVNQQVCKFFARPFCLVDAIWQKTARARCVVPKFSSVECHGRAVRTEILSPAHHTHRNKGLKTPQPRLSLQNKDGRVHKHKTSMDPLTLQCLAIVYTDSAL